jgi:4,5-dihydroxyphthalate decarboxylase
MHLVAIRRDVYERHPFVATSLYKALCAAKELAMTKMRFSASLRYMLPWMGADVEEIDEVFGGDPFPYGIEPNRPTLEALVQYLHDQSLIAAPMKIDDLFVPIHAKS